MYKMVIVPIKFSLGNEAEIFMEQYKSLGIFNSIIFITWSYYILNNIIAFSRIQITYRRDICF